MPVFIAIQNSLRPSNHCEVRMTVTPDGAGSRQLHIRYTVLFRTEYDEVEEIQPVKKKICIIWYDGIYPTIKIVWLYNPTDVFTTWRLLRGNTIAPDSVIRCLLFFAEVPPLGKLAIPFAFMPTEMIQYEVIFLCSFGFETVKILVQGEGGLPNCVELRLDIPFYTERVIREAYRNEVDINDSPPYVEDIEKPHPVYLSMTVSISSKGQRDGYPRMLIKQMWEQPPPYDLLSADSTDVFQRPTSANSMTLTDILKILDGILWDAMHSKMFRHQIEFYAKEEVPTYQQVMKVFKSEYKPKLSRRVTSGICDAIVNKAVFHTYNLNPKQNAILEATEE
ncbi:hypothetical protein B5X24_HaOG212197 [Helicoverpa armigera]|nr:hypothetical protein B5X24_HaOG212197 [Helicoverpa armigera]